MSKITLCLLLAVCATLLETAHADCSNLDRYVIIQSQKSGLVLVADEALNLITLQVYEENVANQFKLQVTTTVGRFYIIHRSTGLAVDAVDYPTGGYIASLSTLSESESQQFHINWDGTIVSAAYPSYALGVMNGDFTAGNLIVLSPYPTTNLEAEKFNLEFAESKHLKKVAV